VTAETYLVRAVQNGLLHHYLDGFRWRIFIHRPISPVHRPAPPGHRCETHTICGLFPLAYSGAVLTDMLMYWATTLSRYLAAGELVAICRSLVGNHKILIEVSHVVIMNASVENDQFLPILS
jgi:hypothetical protein